MGCAYPSTPGLTLRGRSGDHPYRGCSYPSTPGLTRSLPFRGGPG
jgi:hypothetical protein